MIALIAVFVAALLLAAPLEIEGLALATRTHKIHYVPKINTQKSHDQRMALKSSAASSIENSATIDSQRKLNKFQSRIVKALMVTYIASMCAALPAIPHAILELMNCFDRTLFPVYLLYKTKIIDRVRKEKWSLKVAQFCSRWLMRVFPFASKSIFVNADDEQVKNPEPSIWVCNHISMLDLFFVLALDKKMRGKNRRPIKILYWKGLESNPVTGLMCRMCGFIPVDMADNGNGNANEYDPTSFKQMLKSTKGAIEEGFDIGILPEGQPNPTPENGLQPIFSGAFTLAKMSRRPIKMIALIFEDAKEFSSTFEAVAGHFGAHGKDMPEEELRMWLDGSMWKTELARQAATRITSADDADKEEAKKKKSTEVSARTQAIK
ncbi:hypothetical protein ACHAW5_003155 [Stephanodiscus triporus]|uniref:Phospholipid/glycerol acyltransferase domain-containing protein n=1 Tax=Stephanodiscus triporus TaxID=2934178 RepID=A0ABD3MYW9_9STRA